jgi:hypothetical protein
MGNHGSPSSTDADPKIRILFCISIISTIMRSKAEEADIRLSIGQAQRPYPRRN